MTSLRGKVALVVGGFDGMGAAVATRLAQEGARLAILGMPRGSAPAASDRGADSKTIECFADIRDASEVDSQIRQIVEECGRIDIVVITAAVHIETRAGSTSAETADRLIDTNIKGTWNVINSVVPFMIDRQYGKIVTVSSGAGVIGFGKYALYCASKAAVIMMTRALAIDLAPHGININCLAPGPTETPMTEELRTRPELRAELDQTLARLRSRRKFSSSEDMAGMVAFLVSDAASPMHGSCVLADEGYTAGM